ncbi:hypothetical protein EON65_47130 [archaeon]|nr:MAG: hypothetical protein EON65_47130 [archaeon]
MKRSLEDIVQQATPDQLDQLAGQLQDLAKRRRDASAIEEINIQAREIENQFNVALQVVDSILSEGGPSKEMIQKAVNALKFVETQEAFNIILDIHNDALRWRLGSILSAKVVEMIDSATEWGQDDGGLKELGLYSLDQSRYPYTITLM